MISVAAESAVDVKLYELLEEFIMLLRNGQGVSVRDYAKRHPDFAERITADFPALLLAEGIKPRVATSVDVDNSVSSAEAPELLAGYRVIRQIGQGGMGIVYEAEHPRLSRRLAIKVLPGRKRNPTLVERFRREAEAAARLSHPNIVPVFDYGEHNGVPYLTMALIEGKSLDQLLADHRAVSRSVADTASAAGLLTMVTNPHWNPPVQPAPPQRGAATLLIGPEADFQKLAAMGSDVASALSHAHKNGTIHRDIKPGNLILDKSGKIWMTDFGLAKLSEGDSDLSRAGDVIGTPRFMSPEQLRGHCDQRSDIYSLGITLYEMASGVRAWDSLQTAQLMKVRATADLPELSDHAPFVPRALADVIMKACATRPEDRYQSARELQVVLSRFAHGQKTGDRRRRSRYHSSFLDRRWIVAGCSVFVSSLTFGLLYLFSQVPWASARITTPEALISLVQDKTQREKVVEELPSVIEAAIMSKDEKVREQAADLTLTVFAEAMHKADVKASEKTEMTRRIAEITDEYKKSGFVYDKMDHPLTNAIHSLDLARQISELPLSSEDKLAAQGKIASIGEAIRRKLVTDNEVSELLRQLPEEAQKGPSAVIVSAPKLIRFIMLLNRTFEAARTRISEDHVQLQKQLEPQMKENGVKLPAGLKKLKIPDNLEIPGMKDRKSKLPTY